ncbi:MAG: pyrimidine 5'-nucleotidase [Anaerolineae bacterium]
MKRFELTCALFDLDDTLYPKGIGIMEVVSRRINEYMASRLGMDEAMINSLRPRYWREYGTTMRGLMVEYQIDPEDYLVYVHDFSVEEFLAPNEELNQVLAHLPWRKVILTNSPKEHAQQVLKALGIAHHFERIFDIKDSGYIGKPHPSTYESLLSSLGVNAEECIAFDDSLPNLRVAAELGMVTVLVGSAEKVDGVDWAIAHIEESSTVARQMMLRAT